MEGANDRKAWLFANKVNAGSKDSMQRLVLSWFNANENKRYCRNPSALPNNIVELALIISHAGTHSALQ